MKRPLCLCLTLGLLALLVAAARSAQGPGTPGDTGKKGKPPAKGADTPSKRPGPLRENLPPGVTVLYDDLKDGLKGPPRAYLLTPEAFQELLKKSERSAKPEVVSPAECHLKVTVAGDFAQIEAEFILDGKKPHTLVQLGCRGAQISEARFSLLDGKEDLGPPLLEQGPLGYSMVLDKIGKYQLNLSLKMRVAFTASVASRGAERSLDMGLPGSAVTRLTLELPYAVKEIRYNQPQGRFPDMARVPEGKKRRWENLLLGSATSLGLSWQEPVGLPDAGPLLSARGQIVVRLEEQYIQAVAELTLQALRGRAREWRLWLPPQARLKVTPPEGLRYQLLPPDRNHIHTIKLNEPTSEPIKVTVTTVQKQRPLTRWPVGPFTVVDAYQQNGTIEVHASATARRGFRLEYVRAADVEEPGLPREALPGHTADLVGFFRYWKMPLPPNPPPAKSQPAGFVPLEIELRSAQGRVKTEVFHQLLISHAAQGLKVQVTTQITARPLGEPVDYLDVQLPRARPEALARADALSALAGANPASFPGTLPWPSLVLGMLPHEGDWSVGGSELQFPDPQARAARRARIPLSKLPKDESQVVLRGEYTLPAGIERARLEVPRPLTIEDGGAQVKIEVVDGSLELLTQGPAGEMPAPDRHTYLTKLETTPARVDLAWRPYRPELPVEMVTDLTFHERDAHAHQQIAFQFADRRPGDAAQPIRLPVGARNVTVSGGWELRSPPGEGEVIWVFPKARGAVSAPLVLEYDFVLPRLDAGAARKKRGQPDDEAPPFEVPLAWPEKATRAQTKVRLWTETGIVPELVRRDPSELTWKDRGPEKVPGRGWLPVRVLLAHGLHLPLVLRLDPPAPGLAGVAIDRALVQVTVDDEGIEHYRARFLLSKLGGPHLDVRLPAANAAVSVQMRLGGEKVTPEFRDGNKIARLPLAPGLFSGPVVLEVIYQLQRDHPEKERLWHTVLHPPEILGNVFLGRVRWQVAMPGNWVPVVLSPEAHPEQVWGWQNWLPAPEPAFSGPELERWLTGQSADDGQLPSLVCSQTSLEPLRVLRMPRQLWLLMCSGILLLVGLALYFAPLSHYSFWMVAAVLGVGAVVAAALWPAALAAVVYGCEPGAIVLTLLLGFQWMLHQRYHRQVVFMPGFKRYKAGSSLVRGNSSRTRDPSTVDAPNSQPLPVQGQGSSMKGN